MKRCMTVVQYVNYHVMKVLLSSLSCRNLYVKMEVGPHQILYAENVGGITALFKRAVHLKSIHFDGLFILALRARLPSRLPR